MRDKTMGFMIFTLKLEQKELKKAYEECKSDMYDILEQPQNCVLKFVKCLLDQSRSASIYNSKSMFGYLAFASLRLGYTKFLLWTIALMGRHYSDMQAKNAKKNNGAYDINKSEDEIGMANKFLGKNVSKVQNSL